MRRPMNCPKCGSGHTSIQAVTENQKTGCGTILFYLLLAISILGWLILIPILLRGKRSKTMSVLVCQSCGKRTTLAT